jgi:hypothetical protein
MTVEPWYRATLTFVLRTPTEVLTSPGLEEKILELGSGWRDEPSLGPTRKQILELVS